VARRPACTTYAPWDVEPGYSKTAIVNAVTRAAHTEEWRSWTTSEDLERAAGELLYRRPLAMRRNEVEAGEPADAPAPDGRGREESGDDLLRRHVPQPSERPKNLQVSTLQAIHKHHPVVPPCLVLSF